jgi:hypothetical protein
VTAIRGTFGAASYTVSHPFSLLKLTNVQWKHLTRRTYSPAKGEAEMDGKLKGVMALALAIGLIAGAFPAVVSTPGAAGTAQQTVSVRTNKGDRLPLRRTSTVSLPAVAAKQPPVGCDPAFSRVADPARAHIFGLQPHESELLNQSGKRILSPQRISPFLGAAAVKDAYIAANLEAIRAPPIAFIHCDAASCRRSTPPAPRSSCALVPVFRYKIRCWQFTFALRLVDLAHI